MTSDNISKVVATVGDDDLEAVLQIPQSKREEFRRQSSTTADYRQRLIDYFIKYSPWATWSDLASRLYAYGTPSSVEAPRAFITQTPGKTFYVVIILKNVSLRRFITITLSILVMNCVSTTPYSRTLFINLSIVVLHWLQYTF